MDVCAGAYVCVVCVVVVGGAGACTTTYGACVGATGTNLVR